MHKKLTDLAEAAFGHDPKHVKYTKDVPLFSYIKREQTDNYTKIREGDKE